jgi:outer membrane protein
MFFAILTFTAQADTAGLYFGGQVWQSEANGMLGEKSSLIDFNSKKVQKSNYFFAIVHPFHLLPNLRISISSLDTTDNTDLSKEFSFGGERFPISGTETGTDTHTGANMNSTINVNSDVNLNVSYVDYTLYYELSNNDVFSINLGLTARSFKGDLTVTGRTTTVTTVDESEHFDHIHPDTEEISTSTTEGKINFDEIEPMLYVAGNISLSLTSISVFAQSNISLKNEHTLYDYQIGINYDLIDNSFVDINLTLGYRFEKMEFDDLKNLSTDLEFKGVFIGVIAHF